MVFTVSITQSVSDPLCQYIFYLNWWAIYRKLGLARLLKWFCKINHLFVYNRNNCTAECIDLMFDSCELSKQMVAYRWQNNKSLLRFERYWMFRVGFPVSDIVHKNIPDRISLTTFVLWTFTRFYTYHGHRFPYCVKRVLTNSRWYVISAKLHELSITSSASKSTLDVAVQQFIQMALANVTTISDCFNMCVFIFLIFLISLSTLKQRSLSSRTVPRLTLVCQLEMSSGFGRIWTRDHHAPTPPP